jgi:hypothetical protein
VSVLRMDEVEPVRPVQGAHGPSDRPLKREVVPKRVARLRNGEDRDAVSEVLLEPGPVVHFGPPDPKGGQYGEVDMARHLPKELDGVGADAPLIREQLGSQETDPHASAPDDADARTRPVGRRLTPS